MRRVPFNVNMCALVVNYFIDVIFDILALLVYAIQPFDYKVINN